MQVVLLSFFILLFTVLSGCSSKKEQKERQTLFGSKEYIESYVAEIPARWFSAPKRFQLIKDDSKLANHRFWDVKPEINVSRKTLNFVVETPEGSSLRYQTDVASGQLYTDQKYCGQRDVWKRYPKEIDRPPFTIGVVPRVLDQMAQPQKIIIFGDKNYYQENFVSNYFDARIVGGLIEQECPLGLCVKDDQWYSRLVLVGVQPNNSRFNDVENLEDLKLVVDWDYVKAFIENGSGRNIIAQKTFPGFRLGSLVDASQAMHFLSMNSKIFNSNELRKLKTSCYKIYDYFWEKLQNVATNSDNKKLVSQPEQALSSNRRVSVKPQRKIKKEIKQQHQKFTDLYKKLGQQFQTCSKYIYASNIQDDPQRHWVFAYLGSFAKLYELGYYYDCRTRSWQLNSILFNNQLAVPMQEQFNNCTEKDVDFAFKYAIQVLSNLKRENRVSYRYIDYDRGSYGSHNKLYSWVKLTNKDFLCSDTKDQAEKLIFTTFPSDIRWKNVKNDINKKIKK